MNNSYQEDKITHIPFPEHHVSRTVLESQGTWILIFTNIIPISLLVTLEVVKFLQGSFLMKDTNIG
jgi:phospholipid-transporting ATPase